MEKSFGTNKNEQDFNWEKTTALSDDLKRTFKEEPLCLDMDWTKSEETLALRDPRFRGGIARLAGKMNFGVIGSQSVLL